MKGNAEYLFKKDDVIKYCELQDYTELIPTYSTYSTLSTLSTSPTQQDN